MRIQPGGVDIFYIDESGYRDLFTLSAIRVPFIRYENETANFVWHQYLRTAKEWRRALSNNYNVRFRKEIHGVDILQCRGLYHKANRNLRPDEALNLYREALTSLEIFDLQDMSFTVLAQANSRLARQTGIHAGIMGLFQRIRRYCDEHQRNGMIFFDGGHEKEYTKLYRQAAVYLPSGRDGNNLPLDMFVKDANFKRSDLSYFVQMADLVTHAANIKIRHENRLLQARRVRRAHHTLYDSISLQVLNTNVTTRRNDGIAPI